MAKPVKFKFACACQVCKHTFEIEVINPNRVGLCPKCGSGKTVKTALLPSVPIRRAEGAPIVSASGNRLPPVRTPETVVQVGSHGEYWDEVYTKDGEGERLVERTPVRDNTIVYSCRTLIAGLMGNDAAFTGGILYSVQGIGNPAWDTGGTPAVDKSQTVLVDEVLRLIPDHIIYVDPVTNVPLAPGVKSRKIEIKTTLDYLDGPDGFYIREQGLTGGDATPIADTGYFVDIMNHPRRWKEHSYKMVRFVRIRWEV